MNKKTFLIVLLISGLFLSSLVAMNGKLLSLAIPFLVYLIIGGFQTPGDVRLQASRIFDKQSVVSGDSIETQVFIKNLGGALVNLCIEDKVFASLKIIDGQHHSKVALAPGEETELRYEFNTARGVYSWKTMRACASDPFGLFDFEVEVPAPGNILVRPTPLQIRPISLKPNATLPTAGPILARRAGSGTDFWGVREYRTGDALRRINWRLATRHPHKLFTNEYEREETADFGLILDARRLTNAEAVEESLFEYTVSAVATLAKNFLRSGNRVSLLVFGKNILTTFPGYGKHQLDLLLWNLARAKLDGDAPLTTLQHFHTKLFPPRSFLVVFSTVDSRDQDTYALLRAYGYDVLLISPDPVDFTSRILPQNEINTLAFRAARVERILQLKRLLKMGINIIDWQVNKPLEPLVRDRAKQMRNARNG
jgi:uncharacterized protein (DUF58 family)